jgi:hypothetical protein
LANKKSGSKNPPRDMPAQSEDMASDWDYISTAMKHEKEQETPKDAVKNIQVGRNTALFISTPLCRHPSFLHR